MNAPTTLQEAVLYFADIERCIVYFAALRWPSGITCPTCGSKDVGFISTRKIWQCKKRHPKRQFSIRVGTVLEDSPIPLSGWLVSLWLLVSCKNGVSSYEISRAIGVTQKSAWFMMQRLRRGFQQETAVKIQGDVEVDETFIGGKARTMHHKRRKEAIQGRGAVGKAVVVGVLERGGTVVASVVPDRSKDTLHTVVKKHVHPGARVFTDELVSYWGLGEKYVHEVINHAEAYVRGVVHTNGVENFWSLLKRTLSGTYIAVQPYHLFRYIDEQSFRYNNRKGKQDVDRFNLALVCSVGKRLSWAMLTLAAQEVP